ncbi:type III-B CRISPR-associated protein Cas10/Cmr2 [Nostoc sp. PCC 7107]|uniref:type III-B CRISPR-associated protein Cas10/Cmr2 n=1 Tax=Nostoc sp. PCC 7107 TaxID=317936 RepID=UPI00029EF5E1|nr:type III-B CRISPR-associated protein Cas10/Cmr2 [Nostoc sp. PCC 7107]AFY43424.1 CRISPR-associated protein, Crm2 family [Nostoc sp. PCC 7107]
MNDESRTRIITALAWCLAWDKRHNLNQDELSTLHQMRQALQKGQDVPESIKPFVQQAQRLYETFKDCTPKTLNELKGKEDYLKLWEDKIRIGLVYGGATKIKQYVFEAAKLHDIRGASALLDQINLVDLRIFFADYCEESLSLITVTLIEDIEKWLDTNFPNLRKALIPELIIYSTGGNILAFCPAAFVDDLANAIEKRYTHETLTANSCAVGDTFKLLEFRFGLLQDKIEDTFWFDEYENNQGNSIVQAYFDQSEVSDPFERFQNRKNFNELVGKLANQFTQRRNGNKLPKKEPTDKERLSRCYPPIFETHPYLQRDESDRRSAIMRVELPNSSFLSEPLARKRLVGEIAKRESSHDWYDKANLEWRPFDIWIPSWVNKFEDFLNKDKNQQLANRYYGNVNEKVEEARSLREIASASKPSGFVAYIYADGNNMGGYIRQKIKTPQDYRLFSEDIFEATEQSVYKALAQYLHPYQYTPDAKSSRTNKEPVWIHPFEIITIGGDDVLLVVPANKALEISKAIGDEFEEHLWRTGRYSLEPTTPNLLAHRYTTENVPPVSKCLLSMSTGVLITAQDTPIYYADKLVSQLLKSAKKYAKELKKDHKYYGGTVDFLVMKAVTMISSNIKEFREQGLIKNKDGESKLKLYASPYTLYELGGLIETAKAFKKAEFPRSQLYQIRSLLERGKRTAILNYRYFRIRLTNEAAKQELKDKFESAWCDALTNNGNIAPWLSDIASIRRNLLLLIFLEALPPEEFRTHYVVLTLLKKYTYETIWRELVDLYPFIAEETESLTEKATTPEVS